MFHISVYLLYLSQVQCVIHHCVLYNNKNVSNHCSISTLSWVYAETGRKFKELTWAWSGLGLAIMLWQEKKRHLCGVTVAEWLYLANNAISKKKCMIKISKIYQIWNDSTFYGIVVELLAEDFNETIICNYFFCGKHCLHVLKYCLLTWEF